MSPLPLNRTLRIAVIDFVFFTGLAIGTGVAGRVNEYGGFKAIYSIGLVCQFLAFIYGILAIKENKKTLVSKMGFFIEC